ncbi:hypothetical protein LX32DRAFT_405457 [Colletotrichum zoysiae]|uniref:Uncharacterized protein n=1 Tax=Colletotrichum zoysiae TaxID=1216348 RepID=A0AAD9HFT2_9PEZI|nr:hypothetical protein LX32DRAFT_405457 [Colletotrichum zoysiae]
MFLLCISSCEMSRIGNLGADVTHSSDHTPEATAHSSCAVKARTVRRGLPTREQGCPGRGVKDLVGHGEWARELDTTQTLSTFVPEFSFHVGRYLTSKGPRYAGRALKWELFLAQLETLTHAASDEDGAHGRHQSGVAETFLAQVRKQTRIPFWDAKPYLRTVLSSMSA